MDALNNVRIARDRIEALAFEHNTAALKALSEQAIDKLNAWEDLVTQTGYKTYEDEDSMPLRLTFIFDTPLMISALAHLFPGSLQRLSDLKSNGLLQRPSWWP